MNATPASLAYLHGLEAIIIVSVVMLIGGVAFAIILAYILKRLLHRKQQDIDAGEQRQERKI
jgi:phosphate/sulfate permease